MNKHLSIAMFLLGVSLALGFVWGMSRISSAVTNYKQSNVVRVKGYAEHPLVSDRAEWSCTVYSRNETLAAANQTLKEHVGKCFGLLGSAGVKSDELFVGMPDITRKYKLDSRGNSTNELDHFVLARRVVVKSGDVGLVQRVALDMARLLDEGIELSISSPEYTSTEIEQIKIDLLSKATSNGYERARTLAEGSHGRIGGLVSAQQGVFQIVPENSTDVSDWGRYDTSTIRKTVKAVVTLEFAVEK